ncbi:hypothetical protein SAMN05216387_102272 [Nitrosovibrio tenuis]|uniref:Uncharacterized protein n=1 Tax=Nitrosovibrio tenuis TaxID=1233 RepID=A0A1H7ISS5_9PROT|nr:hypothetical protein SAMN05216387_102272 [Nitrosovibrio tenuis]
MHAAIYGRSIGFKYIDTHLIIIHNDGIKGQNKIDRTRKSAVSLQKMKILFNRDISGWCCTLLARKVQYPTAEYHFDRPSPN